MKGAEMLLEMLNRETKSEKFYYSYPAEEDESANDYYADPAEIEVNSFDEIWEHNEKIYV